MMKEPRTTFIQHEIQLHRRPPHLPPHCSDGAATRPPSFTQRMAPGRQRRRCCCLLATLSIDGFPTNIFFAPDRSLSFLPPMPRPLAATTATSLTTQLHRRCVASSLCCIVAVLHRRCVASSLRCIVAVLHRRWAASSLRCIVAALLSRSHRLQVSS